MGDFDAVVVGAGHNGLVCSLYLAAAGWRVLLLERSNQVGGGLKTAELTGPGVFHDLYATNVGLFAASPAFSDFKPDFDRLGLKLRRPDKPYASVFPTGPLRVYRDSERTLVEFAKFDSCDADGWSRLHGFFTRTAPSFLPLFYQEMPSAAAARQIVRAIRSGPADTFRLARLLTQTSRDFVSDYLRSNEARGLFAAWAHHLDFDPDVPGGATFAFVAAMVGYQGGMALAEGGAGRISDALRLLLEEGGGRVITNAEVKRIVISNGKAVAVRLANGGEISASRAVIAGVTPRILYGQLVAREHLKPSFLRAVDAYRYGAGTFVIHLVLRGRPAWKAADDLYEFNYVHVCGSEAEIAATYKQCADGALPTRPLLVVSQPTPTDPSRAPDDVSIVRIHVRTVPGTIRSDAGGTIRVTDWPSAKAPFAERILNLVEEHVPGLRSLVIAMKIVSPDEIECDNPNFIGGDCVSGSHHLRQNFFNRPFRGWSRYRTPINNLYVVGASTWPGGGVNAGSGYLLAKKLLANG